MSIFSLVWVAIVFAAVFKSVFKGAKNKEKPLNQQDKTYNYYQSNQSENGKSADNAKINNQNSGLSGYVKPEQQGSRKITSIVQSKEENKVENKQSTVEYLNQKSDVSKKGHAEEERLGAIRQKLINGGKRTAERLLLGDIPPEGKSLVKCKYCGAENAVPTHSREVYACYFCREDL